MSSMMQQETATPMLAHPVDTLEDLFLSHDWSYERTGDDELIAEITGHCADWRLYFVWQKDLRALYFSCLFDLEVTEAKRAEICNLLALMNEKMWVGHFDLSSEDRIPMYRHTLLMRGQGRTSAEQLEDLVEIAVSECERFYPAFQFVLHGNRSAGSALETSLFETVGTA